MADLTARIKPKKSSAAGEVPQAADLEVAEIAVNTADGKLFVKHTDNSIKEISGAGGGATGLTPSSPVSSQANNSLLLDISQYSGSSVTSIDSDTTTWDLQNSGAFSTSWSTFSGGALDCTTNNGYLKPNLTSTLSETFAGDLTVACWINKTGTTYGPVFDFRNGTERIFVWCNADGTFDGQIGTSGDGWVRTASAVANGDHHIALVREGQVTTFYIDGVSVGTNDPGLVRSITLDSFSTKNIGAWESDPNTYNFTGYIADVVVNNGEAVWTSPFSPPTSNVDYFQSSSELIFPAGSIGDMYYNTATGEHYYRTSVSTVDKIVGYPNTLTPADGEVLTWVDANGRWEPAASSGAVSSVNTQTGAVSLGIEDMDDFQLAPAGTQYNWYWRVTGSWPPPQGDMFQYALPSPDIAISDVDDNGNDITSYITGYTSGTVIDVEVFVNGTSVYVGTMTGWGNVNTSGPSFVFGDMSILSGFSNGDLITLDVADWATGDAPLAEGDILRYDATNSAFVPTASSIGFLSNVSSSPATDGQVLTWNNTNTQWEPAAPSDAVDSVNGQTGTVSVGIEDLDDFGGLGYAGDLVLLAEGADGATAADTGLDSSSNDRTQSGATAKPTYSTSVVKYGTSSFAFNGTDQSLYFPNNTDGLTGSLLTDDFTVECWVRFNAFTADQAIFMDGGYYNNNYTCMVNTVANNPNQFYVRTSTSGSSTTNTLVQGGFSLVVDTWYHFALCRSGNDIRLFIDGTQFGSTITSVTTSLFNNTQNHVVGASRNFSDTEGSYLNGYIDEYRVTQSALYTTTFTPTQLAEENPADGQVLTWVDANSRWEPVTPAVDSVNGQTGVVSLGVDDLDNFALAVTPSANNFTLTGPGDTSPDTSGEWGIGSGLNNFFTWLDADPIHAWLNTVPIGTTVEFVTEGGYVHTAVTSNTSTVNQGGFSHYLSFAGYSWPTELTDAFAANESLTVRDSAGSTVPLTDGDMLRWNNSEGKWQPTDDYIPLATLKTEVAAATDFANFQSRIAAL